MKVLVVGPGREDSHAMATHIATVLSHNVDVAIINELKEDEVMRIESRPELPNIILPAEKDIQRDQMQAAVPMPNTHRRFRVR